MFQLRLRPYNAKCPHHKNPHRSTAHPRTAIRHSHGNTDTDPTPAGTATESPW